MLVKCRNCSQRVDKDTAYKVVVGAANHYYCSKKEYDEIISAKQDKENTYNNIYNAFGYKVTNTSLFKEINELLKTYTYKQILAYLQANMDYLKNVMSKEFATEYARIRYFSAILKNSLADFKEKKEEIQKQLVIDMPANKFKSKNRRKSIAEYEMEVGEE